MLTTLSVILIRCRTLLTHVFPTISPYDLFVGFDQVQLAYLLPMRVFFFFFFLSIITNTSSISLSFVIRGNQVLTQHAYP